MANGRSTLYLEAYNKAKAQCADEPKAAGVAKD
jgi:hypothetical protein